MGTIIAAAETDGTVNNQLRRLPTIAGKRKHAPTIWQLDHAAYTLRQARGEGDNSYFDQLQNVQTALSNAIDAEHADWMKRKFPAQEVQPLTEDISLETPLESDRSEILVASIFPASEVVTPEAIANQQHPQEEEKIAVPRTTWGIMEAPRPRELGRTEDTGFYEFFPKLIPPRIVAGVFDGVSNPSKGPGGKASNFAREISQSFFSLNHGDIRLGALAALDLLDDLAWSFSEKMRNGELMGQTTATFVMIAEDYRQPKEIDGRKLYLCGYGSMGDSRLYLFDRESGRLKQMTRDDTSVADYVDEDDLPLSGHEEYWQKNSHRLRKALGTHNLNEMPGYDSGEYFKGRTGEFPVKEGDLLLLTTDGITKSLIRPQIEAVIKGVLAGPQKTDPTYPICERLIENAQEAGGRDDIEVIAIELGSTLSAVPN